MAGFQADYKIDIAFVIDATGSMEPIIEQVKAMVLTLGDEIKKGLEAAGKGVEALRLRVIDFADFATEGTDTIRVSDFFTMPDEKKQFEDRVMGIDYLNRGGDEPENALEALWVAMNSDWVELPGAKRGRHIIVLITDASPLNLQERFGCPGYNAEDYPNNINDLEDIWNNPSLRDLKLSGRHKRLVLFAPEDRNGAYHSWNEVCSWGNTLYTPVGSGNGLCDVDGGVFDIISEIVRSVG